MSKNPNVRDYIMNPLNLCIVFCFAIFGLLSLGVVGGVMLGERLSFSGYMSGENDIGTDIYYNVLIGVDQKNVRELTVNLTRDCDVDDEMCYVVNIYYYLHDFDYVEAEEGKTYTATETLKTKSFICRNAVITFCTMMRSVGQDCYWSVSDEHRHAVALTNINDQLMTVDLTYSGVQFPSDTKEFWDNVDRYEKQEI